MSFDTELPSVTVLLVNYNGAAHLPTCLDSLARLDYPRERLDVLVVDNGSADASLELIGARYPWVRTLALPRNLGFAGGNNAGAAASTSDCLALLNTDMKVEPSWLRELVAAYDPAGGYACVAGVILDWDGERLDFGEGSVNYCGMGQQIGFGRPLEDVELRDRRDLLFACGGSMLVDRRVFLEVGGFDSEYFAYFEDVDLGWRLWLAGWRVRLAAGARVHHRLHGTGGGLPAHQRRLLYERNALRTLVKNLDDRNLWPLLSAALLLLAERARAIMKSSGEDYELFTGAAEKTETVSRSGLACVHAAADVARDLDRLLAQRAEVQALRRRSDAEIFELFRRPFLPLGTLTPEFVDAMATVTHALRLDALFERRPATRVVVVGGPALRELARALGRSVAVTVATSEPLAPAAGVEVVEVGSEAELDRVVLEADVLVLDSAALAEHPQLAHAPALRIVDVREGDDTARAHADVVLDGNAPLETILDACEEPWRLRRRRPATLTEDMQTLLALARAELRLARQPPPPLPVRVARGVWWRTPERLRRRLRPALRAAQALARQRAGASETASNSIR